MTIGLADKDWRGMYLRDTAMLTDKIETERAAMKERCAKVAYDCATGIEACRKIRAMKDHPH